MNNGWTLSQRLAVTRVSEGTGISFNTMRLRQNGRHFADDTFKRIFVNEKVCILIKISLKFVPQGAFDNYAALV